MSITYTFDKERPLIHTRVSGILTTEDTFRYFQDLQEDPLCPAKAIEVVDFSDVTDFVFHYSEMGSITRRYQATKNNKEILVTVFCCPSQLSYGIGRMLEALHSLTNPDHTVEVIGDYDELEAIIAKRTI